MAPRLIPTPRLTLWGSLVLCGSLALAGLTAPPAAAQVIDLGTGASDLRVRSGVLDFGKVLPARKEPHGDQGSIEERSGSDPAERIVRASYGRGGNGQGPKGPARIETLVLDVGTDYLRHPALKRVGLSGTEWLALFRANVAIESGFNPEARSPVGAIGLGQLMPETAAVLGVDPFDPEENLRGSARYLLAQLEDFGAADLALAAYNAGPEAVRDHGGIPPYAETESHVAKVLRLANATLLSE
jgi:hypothetical protein